MFVCTMILYEYMKSLRNGVNNLFDNMQMKIKIYREFYHGVIYIANERRHVRTYTTLHNLRGTILCNIKHDLCLQSTNS